MADRWHRPPPEMALLSPSEDRYSLVDLCEAFGRLTEKIDVGDWFYAELGRILLRGE